MIFFSLIKSTQCFSLMESGSAHSDYNYTWKTFLHTFPKSFTFILTKSPRN